LRCIVHTCRCLVIKECASNLDTEDPEDEYILEESREIYTPISTSPPALRLARPMTEEEFWTSVKDQIDWSQPDIDNLHIKKHKTSKLLCDYIQQVASINCEFRPNLCRTLDSTALDFIADFIESAMEDIMIQSISFRSNIIGKKEIPTSTKLFAPLTQNMDARYSTMKDAFPAPPIPCPDKNQAQIEDTCSASAAHSIDARQVEAAATLQLFAIDTRKHAFSACSSQALEQC